jgi:hypothetical protein
MIWIKKAILIKDAVEIQNSKVPTTERMGRITNIHT